MKVWHLGNDLVKILTSLPALVLVVMMNLPLALMPAGVLTAQSPETPAAAPQAAPAPPQSSPFPQEPALNSDWRKDISEAMLRLPLAALLGTALAFRPKRKGTPTRTPAVVQTQIILAVVGAVIMLVVGASLARAFGIVGAANLIRYRSKIDDPKDAGVMLCCLAVGLAAGVGLFALAGVSTVFLVAVLAVIETFEPTTSNSFELKVSVGEDAEELRPRLEGVLVRFHIDHSLRSASAEELSYDVKVPFGVETDLITDAIQRLSPDGKLSVAWDEKKTKKAA
jgi:uncharacterized membrane protein YhiD involved in acid resistance